MTVRPFLRHALTAVALLAVVAAPAAAQKGKKGSGDSQPMAAPVRTSSAKSRPMAAPGGRTSSAKSKPMAAPTGRRDAKAKPDEGKGKHKVTHTQAVDVSRRVLVEHGYVVSRVERRGDTQVIYYYRGNNGRGKGKGPLQRMVVRPTADRFVFDGAPADVRRAVTMRLQF